MTPSDVQSEFDPERVVIRDKRKVWADPDSGSGPPDSDRATSGGPAAPDVAQSEEPEPPSEAEVLLAERTADLQRINAEYAAYRRRTERDRVVLGEVAVGGVLASLLPVLDNLERARAHGDLEGALKALADQLDAILAKSGLVAFGEVGDPFDPTVHEAVTHDESPEVTVPSVSLVMRRGYTHGDRLLRPAMVGVSAPASTSAEAEAESE